MTLGSVGTTSRYCRDNNFLWKYWHGDNRGTIHNRQNEAYYILEGFLWRICNVQKIYPFKSS